MTREAQVRVRGVGGLFVLLIVVAVLAGCDLLNGLPTLPPDQAPTGVTASVGQFEDRIEVRWTAVERAASYRVFRAEAQAGPYERIGDAPSVTYTDTVGVENQGRLYWYKVQACNTVGCGPESIAAAGYAGRPPAPTNVRATDGTFADKIVITWDLIPGATHYQVFRDRHPEGDFPIYIGTSTTNQIEDTTALPGLLYWYKVRACRPDACSILSSADRGHRGALIPTEEARAD